MSTTVLVTGASGFVGSEVMRQLHRVGFNVIAASRRKVKKPFESLQVQCLFDFSRRPELLSHVEVVVHCAARAHIMKDKLEDPLTEYRKINVEGTLSLARQAAQCSIKRFIFISSIKVNGESTQPGVPYTEEDTPAPKDPYGISKREAENGLKKIALETGMEIVIIRPPLVYGPGVKGNFASMIKLVDKNLPLPLGYINNKRSLVALDNLVDLIIRCIDHPAAANQVFLASDGQDVSTTEMLRCIGKGMGKSARLIPLPVSILTLAAVLVGKKAIAQRLLNSLQVDISKAQNLLGWKPPLTVEEGFRRCFDSKKIT